MIKRVLLAGLLGGIAMFAWTSVAHMVLPLGDTGMKELPNDQAVLSAMHTSIGEASGFYFFPATGLPPDATMQQRRAAMDQYAQKLAANPSGILIYHPAGAKPISAGQLGTEFFTELIESLLVVILLANAPQDVCLAPGIRDRCRRAGHHRDQCFLLELVRLPRDVHGSVHDHRHRRLPLRRLGGCRDHEGAGGGEDGSSGVS